jgi:hypothetical protein
MHLPKTRVQGSGDLSSPSTQGCIAPRRTPSMSQRHGLQRREVTPMPHGRLHSPRVMPHGPGGPPMVATGLTSPSRGPGNPVPPYG